MTPPLKSQPALDVETLQARIGEIAAVASLFVDHEIGMSIADPGEEQRVHRLGSSFDVHQVPLAYSHALGATDEVNGKLRRDDHLETGHRQDDRVLCVAGLTEESLRRRHFAMEIGDLEERLNLEPSMRAQAVAVVEAYVVDREVEADGVVEA